MGGLYNWNKVESIRLSGTIERDGQIIEIVIIKKRPNQIRATVTIPIPGSEDTKMQFIRAHDGKAAWTATRRTGDPQLKKTELDPLAAETLLFDANVLPKLMAMQQSGAKIELLPPVRINGYPTYTIQATAKDSGRTLTFQLAEDTYRTIQYTETNTSETIVTRVENYQQFDEVYLPTISIIEATQTGHSVIKTESIEVGVGIYDEYFERTDQIQTATLLK